MKHIDSFKFFEAKNYGDLYHSIWKRDNNRVLQTTLSILEKGFKFSDNHGVWEPMLKKDNVYGRKHWNFLKSDELKTISVTRDSSTIQNKTITFVLNGSAISNNYKIEPCNLGAPSEIRVTKLKNMPWGFYNSRYSFEEKILSKKDYLEPKFIKEIIINKHYKEITDSEIEIIKSNAGDIKVTVIDKGPDMIKFNREHKWKNR